jgi:hypothetical protein
MQLFPVQKLLAESEEGGCAVAELPEGYDGPCVVEVHGRVTQRLGFPSVREAVSAAKFAVGALGGFYKAIGQPGKAVDENTYARWSDWAFSA